MQKINIIWAINLILFIAVVFVGIEQGSRGAKISKIESEIDIELAKKVSISESIFKNSVNGSEEKVTELGYLKPTDVVYFDMEDVTAKLPTR